MGFDNILSNLILDWCRKFVDPSAVINKYEMAGTRLMNELVPVFFCSISAYSDSYKEYSPGMDGLVEERQGVQGFEQPVLSRFAIVKILRLALFYQPKDLHKNFYFTEFAS